MESEIKPKVLNTVQILTKDYSKLIKYQKERLNCILNSINFSNSLIYFFAFLGKSL